MFEQVAIGVVGSVAATILVLLTRIGFYKVRDLFPARALFHGILGSDRACLVFILRMTDTEEKSEFKTPMPRYSVVVPQHAWDVRVNVPWVNSTSETQAVAHVLNVLGRAGRTKNIKLAFADQDFDVWESPMFILGGSPKMIRAFANCNPYFELNGAQFILKSTGEVYKPQAIENDLGLLHKMINPSTGFPIWAAWGLRGAGTVAAAYALVRWWKELGILYGKSSFGVVVELDDRDGWQQLRILRLYPEPRWHQKILHPIAWRVLSRDSSQIS
jgi:uncharacterized membrane protein YeaQ/YmgE (transglycosylase-associated protein family)